MEGTDGMLQVSGVTAVVWVSEALATDMRAVA
jgi:hypothetical protein